MRLDKKLRELNPEISRNQIEQLIQAGLVMVNNQIITKKNHITTEKDIITIRNTSTNTKATKHKEIELELDIIYEDDNILALNKPAGLSVHPRDNNDQQTTLVNGLLHYLKDNISQESGDTRPGIVHRLDKDTSGAIIIAKNNKTHNFLAKQFAERTTIKIYKALVVGRLTEPAQIEAPIGRSQTDRKKMSINEHGRYALTEINPINHFTLGNKELTLLEVKIYTGRTHQIRVHLNAIGHPIVGDKTYGNKTINNLFAKNFQLERQFLHAEKLTINIPNQNFTSTKKELYAKPPSDLNNVLKKLKQLS